MSEHLRTTPGLYIVIGVSHSYILPYFQKDSIFYGLNFSKKVDELVMEKIHQNSFLPLRILVKDSSEHCAKKFLQDNDYDHSHYKIVRSSIETKMGLYYVYEVLE